MENPVEETQVELVDRVIDHIEAGDEPQLRELVADLHPADNAGLLESLPPEERNVLWEAVPAEQEGEILTHLRDEVRATIIDEMGHEALVAAAGTMDVADLAEVLEEIPGDLSERIVQSLEEDHRKRLEAVLSYAEGTAGRLMSTDVISVRKDVTLGVVLRWLRRHENLPPRTDSLMVITPQARYLGKLDMARVVTGNPDASVETVMEPDAETLRATSSEHEIVTLFARRDLISVAVLDDDGRLLGRITVDDVVDVIREEADRVLLNSAGLEEQEDLFAPGGVPCGSASTW